MPFAIAKYERASQSLGMGPYPSGTSKESGRNTKFAVGAGKVGGKKAAAGKRAVSLSVCAELLHLIGRRALSRAPTPVTMTLFNRYSG